MNLMLTLYARHEAPPWQLQIWFNLANSCLHWVWLAVPCTLWTVENMLRVLNLGPAAGTI